ncbi:MAG: nucleotide exchange factor GrpE, partial [Gammaproteobacteria bacterium]|nr:nucleotide exchange factor GrpE [Gammaproteobacteria bacterium]
LELGVAAAQEADANVEKLREGKELTLKMLEQAMDKFSIEAVDPTGDKFDPELHQAMTMQPSQDHPANTVLQVIQKGYTLNGRLIRPAMVIVSQG